MFELKNKFNLHKFKGELIKDKFKLTKNWLKEKELTNNRPNYDLTQTRLN